MENIDEIIVIWLLLKDIILGGIGGIVGYLFDYRKALEYEKPFRFRWSSLGINIAMGMFVSYSVGSVFDEDLFARNILLMISGFSAYNILLLSESRFANFLFERFELLFRGKG